MESVVIILVAFLCVSALRLLELSKIKNVIGDVFFPIGYKKTKLKGGICFLITLLITGSFVVLNDMFFRMDILIATGIPLLIMAIVSLVFRVTKIYVTDSHIYIPLLWKVNKNDVTSIEQDLPKQTIVIRTLSKGTKKVVFKDLSEFNRFISSTNKMN